MSTKYKVYSRGILSGPKPNPEVFKTLAEANKYYNGGYKYKYWRTTGVMPYKIVEVKETVIKLSWRAK